MAKFVFTDDTFTILATIPIASVWPSRQNAFESAKASEVLAGKGRRLRCVNHVVRYTTPLMKNENGAAARRSAF